MPPAVRGLPAHYVAVGAAGGAVLRRNSGTFLCDSNGRVALAQLWPVNPVPLGWFAAGLSRAQSDGARWRSPLVFTVPWDG